MHPGYHADSLYTRVASNGDDLRENTLPYRGFQRVFHDEVYLVSDNAAQFLFQPDKGEQPRGFAEFNENINVAVFFSALPVHRDQIGPGIGFCTGSFAWGDYPAAAEGLEVWCGVERPGASWTLRILLYRSTHQNTWYLLFDLELINRYDSDGILWENLQITRCLLRNGIFAFLQAFSRPGRTSSSAAGNNHRRKYPPNTILASCSVSIIRSPYYTTHTNTHHV